MAELECKRPFTLATDGNLASIETTAYGDAMPWCDPLEPFPLTLSQAAAQLAMTPEGVVELVRLGELSAYLTAGISGGSPPTLRFSPADLHTFTVDGDPETARLVATTGALLRRYLQSCSPIPASTDAPMLARDRGREVYAHIQLDAFQDWIRTTEATDARLYFSGPLRTAVRRLGCRPLRGIRPLHLTTMVWASWWRVPPSLWSLSLAELTALDRTPT